MTPLTVATAATPWVIDEFGIGLALTTPLAAWLAWRARSRDTATVVPQPAPA